MDEGNNRNRILLGLIPAMVLPFAASMVYFVLLAGTTIAKVLYATTKTMTVLWPIISLRWIEGGRVQLKIASPKKHFSALPLGALTGGLMGGAILGLFTFTPLGGYVEGFAADIGDRVKEMGLTSPGRYVIFCVFLAGLHSLIEEFFWRWYVFGRLVRVMRTTPAYLLAGLGFAGHHYVVLSRYFPAWGTIVFGTAVGVGGGLWCWMYRRQGTLAGAWLSHALVDVAIFYIGYQLIFA